MSLTILFSKTKVCNNKSVSSFFIALIILCFNTNVLSAQKTTAEYLVTIAAQKASTSKNVFVKFSASWCGWCKRMDKALTDSLVKPIVDKYYIRVNLVALENLPNKKLETPKVDSYIKNNKLNVSGLPYWLILNSNKKILANCELKADKLPLSGKGENVGCPSEPEEIEYFLRVLKATSKITDTEIEIVKKRFEKLKE